MNDTNIIACKSTIGTRINKRTTNGSLMSRDLIGDTVDSYLVVGTRVAKNTTDITRNGRGSGTARRLSSGCPRNWRLLSLLGGQSQDGGWFSSWCRGSILISDRRWSRMRGITGGRVVLVNRQEIQILCSTNIMQVEATPWTTGRSWRWRWCSASKYNSLGLWRQLIPNGAVRRGKGKPLITRKPRIRWLGRRPGGSGSSSKGRQCGDIRINVKIEIRFLGHEKLSIVIISISNSLR